MMRAAHIVLAAASLFGVPVADAEAPTPNLSGLWTFEAELGPVCRFTGQARLTPAETPGEYGCELTARQDCPSVDVLYVVEQSCTFTVEDDIATVQSSILGFLQGQPTENYLPDNFKLVVEDRAHLKGVLIGSNTFPAEWRRAEGAIS